MAPRNKAVPYPGQSRTARGDHPLPWIPWPPRLQGCAEDSSPSRQHRCQHPLATRIPVFLTNRLSKGPLSLVTHISPFFSRFEVRCPESLFCFSSFVPSRSYLSLLAFLLVVFCLIFTAGSDSPVIPVGEEYGLTTKVHSQSYPAPVGEGTFIPADENTRPDDTSSAVSSVPSPEIDLTAVSSSSSSSPYILHAPLYQASPPHSVTDLAKAAAGSALLAELNNGREHAVKSAALAASEVAWDSCSAACGGGWQSWDEAAALAAVKAAVSTLDQSGDKEALLQLGQKTVVGFKEQSASWRRCHDFPCLLDNDSYKREMVSVTTRDAPALARHAADAMLDGDCGIYVQLQLATSCREKLLLLELTSENWKHQLGLDLKPNEAAKQKQQESDKPDSADETTSGKKGKRSPTFLQLLSGYEVNSEESENSVFAPYSQLEKGQQSNQDSDGGNTEDVSSLPEKLTFDLCLELCRYRKNCAAIIYQEEAVLKASGTSKVTASAEKQSLPESSETQNTSTISPSTTGVAVCQLLRSLSPISCLHPVSRVESSASRTSDSRVSSALKSTLASSGSSPSLSFNTVAVKGASFELCRPVLQSQIQRTTDHANGLRTKLDSARDDTALASRMTLLIQQLDNRVAALTNLQHLLGEGSTGTEDQQRQKRSGDRETTELREGVEGVGDVKNGDQQERGEDLVEAGGMEREREAKVSGSSGEENVSKQKLSLPGDKEEALLQSFPSDIKLWRSTVGVALSPDCPAFLWAGLYGGGGCARPLLIHREMYRRQESGYVTERVSKKQSEVGPQSAASSRSVDGASDANTLSPDEQSEASQEKEGGDKAWRKSGVTSLERARMRAKEEEAAAKEAKKSGDKSSAAEASGAEAVADKKPGETKTDQQKEKAPVKKANVAKKIKKGKNPKNKNNKNKKKKKKPAKSAAPKASFSEYRSQVEEDDQEGRDFSPEDFDVGTSSLSGISRSDTVADTPFDMEDQDELWTEEDTASFVQLNDKVETALRDEPVIRKKNARMGFAISGDPSSLTEISVSSTEIHPGEKKESSMKETSGPGEDESAEQGEKGEKEESRRMAAQVSTEADPSAEPGKQGILSEGDLEKSSQDRSEDKSTSQTAPSDSGSLDDEQRKLRGALSDKDLVNSQVGGEKKPDEEAISKRGDPASGLSTKEENSLSSSGDLRDQTSAEGNLQTSSSENDKSSSAQRDDQSQTVGDQSAAPGDFREAVGDTSERVRSEGKEGLEVSVASGKESSEGEVKSERQVTGPKQEPPEKRETTPLSTSSEEGTSSARTGNDAKVTRPENKRLENKEKTSSSASGNEGDTSSTRGEQVSTGNEQELSENKETTSSLPTSSEGGTSSSAARSGAPGSDGSASPQDVSSTGDSGGTNHDDKFEGWRRCYSLLMSRIARQLRRAAAVEEADRGGAGLNEQNNTEALDQANQDNKIGEVIEEAENAVGTQNGREKERREVARLKELARKYQKGEGLVFGSFDLAHAECSIYMLDISQPSSLSSPSLSGLFPSACVTYSPDTLLLLAPPISPDVAKLLSSTTSIENVLEASNNVKDAPAEARATLRRLPPYSCPSTCVLTSWSQWSRCEDATEKEHVKSLTDEEEIIEGDSSTYAGAQWQVRVRGLEKAPFFGDTCPEQTELRICEGSATATSLESAVVNSSEHVNLVTQRDELREMAVPQGVGETADDRAEIEKMKAKRLEVVEKRLEQVDAAQTDRVRVQLKAFLEGVKQHVSVDCVLGPFTSWTECKCPEDELRSRLQRKRSSRSRSAFLRSSFLVQREAADAAADEGKKDDETGGEKKILGVRVRTRPVLQNEVIGRGLGCARTTLEEKETCDATAACDAQATSVLRRRREERKKRRRQGRAFSNGSVSHSEETVLDGGNSGRGANQSMEVTRIGGLKESSEKADLPQNEAPAETTTFAPTADLALSAASFNLGNIATPSQAKPASASEDGDEGTAGFFAQPASQLQYRSEREIRAHLRGGEAASGGAIASAAPFSEEISSLETRVAVDGQGKESSMSQKESTEAGGEQMGILAFGLVAASGVLLAFTFVFLLIGCSKKVRRLLAVGDGAPRMPAKEEKDLSAQLLKNSEARWPLKGLFPLTSPDGNEVCDAQGLALIVTSCVSSGAPGSPPRGAPLTTSVGERIFRTRDGNLVGEWGEALPVEVLPMELRPGYIPLPVAALGTPTTTAAPKTKPSSPPPKQPAPPVRQASKVPEPKSPPPVLLPPEKSPTPGKRPPGRVVASPRELAPPTDAPQKHLSRKESAAALGEVPNSARKSSPTGTKSSRDDSPSKSSSSGRGRSERRDSSSRKSGDGGDGSRERKKSERKASKDDRDRKGSKEDRDRKSSKEDRGRKSSKDERSPGSSSRRLSKRKHKSEKKD
ncbi:hypothetical protein CSUI_004618 [Cystoisospora suis]|uniref:Transmembrane protein n=1 Tax=Cystoisospora suis TaxID=483139 RepID=A0A2C6KWN3_9APIC|nr:hypothetical protein CSUI_004618 [Cystoisospora suis]